MFGKGVKGAIVNGKVFHRILGVWPENDQFLGKYSQVKGYVFVVAVAATYLFQCAELYMCFVRVSHDDALIESISEVTVSMIAVLKVIPSILKRNHILKLLKMTEAINEAPNFIIKKIEVQRRWDSYQNELIKFCIISYSFIFLAYVCTPLLSDKKFPLITRLPPAAYVYPWYQIVYVIESFVSLLLLIGSLSNDSFCITFICQLCGELEFVRCLMMKLDQKDKVYLPDVINRHAIALEYGNQICKCFESIFLVEHIVISIFLCFSGITILKINNSFFIIRIITLSVLMIFTLLIICFVGETVSNASLEIADAIDTQNFHHFLGSIDSLKSLKLILCRAQKPLRMTVGWNSSMNLKFFTDTMNKLVSGFMVLKAAME